MDIWFEDLPEGRTLDLGERLVTREEIVAFATEFDPQPHHLDDEAAAKSILGGLSASGWHTCAMMMRMLVDGLAIRAASMGSPGIEEVRWMRPVRPGDVLRMKGEVKAARVSKSRPEMGIVDIEWTLHNQREQVAWMKATGLYGVRHPAAGGSA
ncbi:MAG: MaoC family dehydratase [Alphaproteobacteria bacterium]|nr:MaoC family dehydratase [Alphaproteobacteria bacterium]